MRANKGFSKQRAQHIVVLKHLWCASIVVGALAEHVAYVQCVDQCMLKMEMLMLRLRLRLGIRLRLRTAHGCR